MSSLTIQEILTTSASFAMKYRTLTVLYLCFSLHCFQRHTVEAQLITAGTYYQKIKTNGGSNEMSDQDTPFLTEEMFHCSRTPGCSTLGKRKDKMAFEEVSSGADRSGYDEIVEKTKSGELYRTIQYIM